MIAVIWDSMLSPATSAPHARAARARRHGRDVSFDRAKTGAAAAGTLTHWSEADPRSYLAWLGVEPLDNAPLFRTAGAMPGPKGGRRWPPQPYTRTRWTRTFAEIRAGVFGEDERRQLADMRRSGAVEGDAGGAALAEQSNKMANTISVSNRLRKTYNPVNVTSVRRFDEARERGAASSMAGTNIADAKVSCTGREQGKSVTTSADKCHKPRWETKSLKSLAGATGLEPATFGVTGRRSNQLSYAPFVGSVAGLNVDPVQVKVRTRFRHRHSDSGAATGGHRAPGAARETRLAVAALSPLTPPDREKTRIFR